jgi:hypothetical protein
MLSKASFDLDHSNNPVVKLEITSTPDVRDKIAKRFIEALGNSSQWCEIFPSGESEYIIYPVRPEEMRKMAAHLVARADESEGKTVKTKGAK